MRIGLIGAGNMAVALARGWGEPVLVRDPDADRASALADAVGGEVLASSADLARRADLVVLCHKPAQLAEVAAEVGDPPAAVASILWGVRTGDLEAAYPSTPVYRFIPNIPVEVGRGVLGYAGGEAAASGPEDAVLDLFGRLGVVIPVEEDLMDAAGAVLGCGPAFFALVAEALADAGMKRGLDSEEARMMAVETMAGTAASLHERELDTGDLRRRVASPGGVTERGLEVLERAGIREDMDRAAATVLGER